MPLPIICEQKVIYDILHVYTFAMILSIIEVDFSKQNDNLGGVMLARSN